MRLIADSGSTKTHWSAVDEQQVWSYETEGVNPVLQSAEEVENSICSGIGQKLSGVTEIHFYGAGCVAPMKDKVVSALKKSFPGAVVEVESDLLGAARSVLGRSAGVACILGTGSNSCLYDGEKMVGNTPSLGYILGDEGSGSYIGKRFVADYFKFQMPENLRLKFQEETGLDVPTIVDRVYRQPFGNRFVAQYTKFINQNIQDPYCEELVVDSFSQFLIRNIKPYGDQTVPVSFVGSIAHYFRDQLQLAIENNGMKLGKILQSPIDGLLEYHLNA